METNEYTPYIQPLLVYYPEGSWRVWTENGTMTYWISRNDLEARFRIAPNDPQPYVSLRAFLDGRADDFLRVFYYTTFDEVKDFINAHLEGFIDYIEGP